MWGRDRPRFVAALTQTGNMSITDKGRAESLFISDRRGRDFEIENAHTVTRFAPIRSAVTRADHNSMAGAFFSTKIDHRVGDGRIALDIVGARPKEKIARRELRQFEAVVLATNHRFEFSRLSQPGVLLA